MGLNCAIDLRTSGSFDEIENSSYTGRQYSFVESPLSGSTLRQFAGRYYASELDIIYEIEFGGEFLFVSVGNDIDGRLEHLGNDRFDRNGLIFRFERDSNRVTGFRLDAGRVKNLRFEMMTTERE